MNSQSELKAIAKLFLKLGLIGFGGPAAHISMMHDEVVTKKKWLNEDHFLDLVGATHLIPGPNSTEMAIHIGQEKGGWKGLIVAGLCFIIPAVIITGVFAWFYKQYGQLPQVLPFIYGIKPAIIAVILAAIFPLAKRSFKNVQLSLIGVLVLLLSLLGVNEIYLLFGAGIFALLILNIQNPKKTQIKSVFPFALINASNFNIITFTNLKLLGIFIKIGAILYGSGYVLFAFLDSELVSTGIMSRNQLIDAIAVGQFTPGPVFSSVTFIGYQINGISGALISTIGIFIPSFLFVAFLNPLVKKMRHSKLFSHFLDAVNVASVALIVSVCFTMAKESISDWRTILIGLISILVVFLFKKINSAWIIIGASVLGYLLTIL